VKALRAPLSARSCFNGSIDAFAAGKTEKRRGGTEKQINFSKKVLQLRGLYAMIDS